MNHLQLTELNNATLPQLKELIDTMQKEVNHLPTLQKKVDATKLIGKIIDIYTLKRFGKKL